MTKTTSSLSAQQAGAIKRLAGKYNTRTKEADDLRVQLDQLVAEARASGGTFREIAALANRSVAWVQGSLQRTESRSK
jgi:hypothetical protein